MKIQPGAASLADHQSIEEEMCISSVEEDFAHITVKTSEKVEK